MEILQHLIDHASYGKLFPNRLAVAAFGLENRHQIDKYRPQLEEGLEWITLPSETGGKPRIYYTIPGLEKLCNLIQTPQAQQIKQELLSPLQPQNPSVIPVPVPGGALVPHPHHYSPEPSSSSVGATGANPLAVFPAIAPSMVHTPAIAPPSHPHSVPHPIPEPVKQLSQHLQSHLAPTVSSQVSSQVTHQLSQQVSGMQKAIAHQLSHQQASTPTYQQIHHSTAQAQDRAVGYFQAGVQAAQSVQENTANIVGDRTYINTNTETHTESNWLESQDRMAFALVCALVFSLIGITAYCLFSLSSSRKYSPQSHAPISHDYLVNRS